MLAKKHGEKEKKKKKDVMGVHKGSLTRKKWRIEEEYGGKEK